MTSGGLTKRVSEFCVQGFISRSADGDQSGGINDGTARQKDRVACNLPLFPSTHVPAVLGHEVALLAT